jgi:hypothetical protein
VRVEECGEEQISKSTHQTRNGKRRTRPSRHKTFNRETRQQTPKIFFEQQVYHAPHTRSHRSHSRAQPSYSALAAASQPVLAMTRMAIPSFSGPPPIPSTTTEDPQHHPTLLSRGLITPPTRTNDPNSRKQRQRHPPNTRKPLPSPPAFDMASSSTSTPLL